MSGLRNSSHRKHVPMDIPVWAYILSPIIMVLAIPYFVVGAIIEAIDGYPDDRFTEKNPKHEKIW